MQVSDWIRKFKCDIVAERLSQSFQRTIQIIALWVVRRFDLLVTRSATARIMRFHLNLPDCSLAFFNVEEQSVVKMLLRVVCLVV